MLSLHEITKSFSATEILHGVSITVGDKKIVGLLGPNGAGKTTIMRIITGFLTPTTGEVLWHNKPIDTTKPDYKRMIGYLPENNPLYGWMTAGEYLDYIFKLKTNENNLGEVRRVCEQCGLTEVIHKKIEILSKGYKQRVGLASALLGDPQLLVLDEPTSGLDPNQIIEIRTLIQKLSKEKSVILSTHILPEAKALCNDLVIINRGMIVLEDSVAHVKNLEKKFVELTA